ncbi:hypothetical protein [Streptomyces radicis]|nr:hypothetical protein [Streptomyces radicis]
MTRLMRALAACAGAAALLGALATTAAEGSGTADEVRADTHVYELGQG